MDKVPLDEANGRQDSAPGAVVSGDVHPVGTAAPRFEFDLFISYATDPDYFLARDLHRFLTTFHTLPAIQRHAVPALRVCLDSGSFVRRRAGRVLSVEEVIEDYLAASRELLVLCSPGAARSGYVADEITWFLEHRGKDAVHLAVTHGADPVSTPEQVFPPPVLQARMERSVWFDLRGLRGWRARGWKRVRDASRERLRLAADVLTGTGTTAELTAEDLYPDWLEQEQRQKRRSRSRWTLASVAFVAAVLAAGAGAWRSSVQGDLASLRSQAAAVGRETAQEPERAMRHAADTWRDWQQLVARTRFLPGLDDEMTLARIEAQHALFTALSARPGLAGAVTPPLDNPLVTGSRDGTRFAAAGTSDGAHAITLWNANTVLPGRSQQRIEWGERVQCLALDANGERLIAAGRRYVGIWSRDASGALQHAQTLDLAAGDFSDLSCSSAAISPNGRTAILGSNEGRLFEVDLSSGRMAPLDVKGVAGVINSLVFDPARRAVYVAAWQRERPLLRVDLAVRPVATQSLDGPAAPRALALSADGSTLYSVHEQGTITARATASGQVIAQARVSGASLVDLAVVADGLVVGDEAGTLTSLTFDLKRRRSPVQMARSTITSLASSPANGWVMVAGAGDPVRLWRTDAAQPLEQVVARDVGGGLGAGITADAGRLSVFGSEDVMSWVRSGDAWHAELKRTIAMPEGWRLQAAARDGAALAVSAAYARKDADDLIRLATREGTIRILPGFAAKLWKGAFSASDRRLAVGGFDRPLRVAVWDLQLPEARPWIFETKEGAGATAVAFSRDESLLAVSDMRSCVHVVALASTPLAQPRSYCDKTDMPGELDFDSSGSRLVVGSLSGRIKVLRVSPQSVDLERIVDAHEKPTTALAFDESGRWLASAADDGSLRFWDTATWQPIGAAQLQADGFVRDIAPVPGGGRFLLLAQGGRMLSVWDVDPDRAADRAKELGAVPAAPHSLQTRQGKQE